MPDARAWHVLKRHGRHVPEQRLLLRPCCIAGSYIMPIHFPIKHNVEGQHHIGLPLDRADSDSRLATVVHDRQQTDGSTSGLAWTQTPAVRMPHRNRQPVRAIMRRLFGRSKSADGGFTQQQVNVFAVLQAAPMAAQLHARAFDHRKTESPQSSLACLMLPASHHCNTLQSPSMLWHRRAWLPADIASSHDQCLICPSNRNMGCTYPLTRTQVAHQAKTAITELLHLAY